MSLTCRNKLVVIDLIELNGEHLNLLITADLHSGRVTSIENFEHLLPTGLFVRGFSVAYSELFDATFIVGGSLLP